MAIADTVGDEVGLTVDTLHVMRTGGTWADFAALPTHRITHVQINDGPLQAPADLAREATHERMVPGQGEFDLAGFLALVPQSAQLAVEAPFRAPAGISPLERARVIVEATGALLI